MPKITGIFKCESCDYSTDTKYNLTRHVRSNHSENSESTMKPVNMLFKCKHCIFCGRSIDGLNKHMKSQHKNK